MWILYLSFPKYGWVSPRRQHTHWGDLAQGGTGPGKRPSHIIEAASIVTDTQCFFALHFVRLIYKDLILLD